MATANEQAKRQADALVMSIHWGIHHMPKTIADYQPVVVTTHLARGIPFWVKTLLGTDVTHLGFKVEYEKFEDNLWFPVEYGGEFKLKALFFYKRNMAIALHNHGFQRSSVTTVLTYDDPFSISTEVPATDSH